jgi:2,3-dihydroxybenzoate decarboxylase
MSLLHDCVVWRHRALCRLLFRAQRDAGYAPVVPRSTNAVPHATPHHRTQEATVTVPRRALVTATPIAAVAASAGAVAQGSTASTIPKVALEEHVITAPLMPYLEKAFPPTPRDAHDTIIRRLSDFGDERLAAMDEAGVAISVLSISGPGVQIEPDARLATRLASGANDTLAREIAKRPTRYAGFAHLAMQDPATAADELERCVTQLGFKGALVNGHTNGVYLDDPRHDVFWERLQALDVSLYLHPGDSFRMPFVLEGFPELQKPVWEWTTETSSHALRLIVSGVFDRFPRAQVILGHMGEAIPYELWRLDSRYAFTETTRRVKRKPSAYVRENFYVTTSGQFADVPLMAAIGAMGHGRVLFSIDYPYESSEEAARFMAAAPLGDAARRAVAGGNARALLHLPAAP